MGFRKVPIESVALLQTPLVLKKSDSPALNVTDTTFVQSPSKFFLKGPPLSKHCRGDESQMDMCNKPH